MPHRRLEKRFEEIGRELAHSESKPCVRAPAPTPDPPLEWPRPEFVAYRATSGPGEVLTSGFCLRCRCSMWMIGSATAPSYCMECNTVKGTTRNFDDFKGYDR